MEKISVSESAQCLVGGGATYVGIKETCLNRIPGVERRKPQI